MKSSNKKKNRSLENESDARSQVEQELEGTRALWPRVHGFVKFGSRTLLLQFRLLKNDQVSLCNFCK